MKCYDEVLNKNLNFEIANKLAKNKKQFITRPRWEGLCFYDKNHNSYTLLKNGELRRISEDTVYDKDTNDWMIVVPTKEALSIIKKVKR